MKVSNHEEEGLTMLVRTIRIASLVPLLLATLLSPDALAGPGTLKGNWTFTIDLGVAVFPGVEVKFTSKGQCTMYFGSEIACAYREDQELFSIAVEISADRSPNGLPQTWVLRGSRAQKMVHGTLWAISDVSDDSDFGVQTLETTFTGTRDK
jgi:hypothetical protein